MPITIGGTDYLTTQEAMALLSIKSRETWRNLTRQYDIQHHAQAGKSKRYLWQRSDVERMLEPIDPASVSGQER